MCDDNYPEGVTDKTIDDFYGGASDNQDENGSEDEGDYIYDEDKDWDGEDAMFVEDES